MNPSHVNTESSTTLTGPPPGWWQSRTILLALALHGFLFLGLFQLSYSDNEWDRILTTRNEHGIAAAANHIMQEHGLFGLVKFYYSTHGEAKLYYRYAKLTLSGDA